MGFFSAWKDKKQKEFKQATAPYRQARDEVWAQEAARIGEGEFKRRIRLDFGEAKQEGFEDWRRQLDDAVMRRAHDLDRG